MGHILIDPDQSLDDPLQKSLSIRPDLTEAIFRIRADSWHFLVDDIKPSHAPLPQHDDVLRFLSDVYQQETWQSAHNRRISLASTSLKWSNAQHACQVIAKFNKPEPNTNTVESFLISTELRLYSTSIFDPNTRQHAYINAQIFEGRDVDILFRRLIVSLQISHPAWTYKNLPN